LKDISFSIEQIMKYFLPSVLYLFLLTVLIQTTEGQTNADLKTADSFYTKQHWTTAKLEYQRYLEKDSTNSMAWNKLGYCNQNLNLYQEAIRDYTLALANNPPGQVKNIALMRTAMVYSLMNKTKESTDWLVKATATGYNSLMDLDSLEAFRNLRVSSNFREIRKQVYEIVYPCSKEPRNRDFDFWIGDWNCYRTGTQILSGSSHIESIAGGCAILENYISTQAYTGKSFNFYDTVTGKWEQDWIGAGGPGDRQRYYNGEFKNRKMQFIYETTNPTGEKVKGNFIFYFINQDSVRQYQDIMDANGKTISVTYDLTYRRKN
jgi:tetratricopeptide (TPR) repeat protein